MPPEPSPSTKPGAQALPEGPKLISLPGPTRIDKVFPKVSWLQLAHHLHNGNDRFAFVMVWTNEADQVVFARSKNVEIESAIESCWDSIQSSDRPPFAVATYNSNPAGDSRWACIDVDAHSPLAVTTAEWQLKRMMRVIKDRIPGMIKEGVAMLLEESGRGFHIFLIRADYWPTAKWHRLLQIILGDAFCDIKGHRPALDGIDLFPSAPIRGGSLGKAVRLPGAPNPSTREPSTGEFQVSRVLAHFNLDPLLATLDQKYNQRGSSFGYSRRHRKPKAAKVQAKPKPTEKKPLHTLKEAERLLRSHAITCPSTRHNQLVKLVSEGFYNFGEKALRHLAAQQYNSALCPPVSTLDCHLQEFAAAYSSMLVGYPDRLSPQERAAFSSLSRQRAREAFIIAQNFARHGKSTLRYGKDGRFPLSSPELGSRLDASHAYGDQIRRKMVADGFLRLVESGGFPHRANMYVWTLPLNQ